MNGRRIMLETKDLSVGYNNIPLINDISLSVNQGEIITLIGPNGGGKSTILKTISKNLSLIKGCIYIDSEDLKSISIKEFAKKTAVVLTRQDIPDLMTCFEFASMGRYPYTGRFGILSKNDKRIVENALKKVHALDLSDKYINEISDGQRQKILLACALCQEPSVIILDEPTQYLDINHKSEILSVLFDMAKKEKITVIMSLHETDLAMKISDRVVCVKGEKIFSCGTPEEIFTSKNMSLLYGIDENAFDELTGTVNMPCVKGEKKVFVIGGNGSGITYCRALQRKRIPFCMGIIYENDIDMPFIRHICDDMIIAKAFMPVDDDLIDKAKEKIDGCEYVIDCGCVRGEYNMYIDDLLSFAHSRNKKVIDSIYDLERIKP